MNLFTENYNKMINFQIFYIMKRKRFYKLYSKRIYNKFVEQTENQKINHNFKN